MTKELVFETLKTITYPGFSKDIVTFGFVKNIDVYEGNVLVELEISSSSIEVANELKADITNKLKNSGAKDIVVQIKTPNMPKETSSKGKNVAPQIKNFVMVSSGKGGVGKSTTTVNLAIASAMQGKKVGILDGDIYGPNVPRMLGLENSKPDVSGERVIPLNAFGVEVMSMGVLMEEGQSLIWRGAMIMKVIEQLLKDIAWSDLDILFIDMPPGTGDAQLTLAQSVPVTAGITVTTPQVVSLDDSKRSLDMFKKLHIPIAGVVENMSGFICPNCQSESDIFGRGTAKAVAESFDTKLIAQIPIEPSIREGGDSGKPIVYFAPESETAKRYHLAVNELLKFLDENQNVSNEMIQPTSTTSACSTQSQPKSGGCGCH